MHIHLPNLSGAILTKQGQDLSAVEVERDAVERLAGAESLGHVPHGQQRPAQGFLASKPALSSTRSMPIALDSFGQKTPSNWPR